MKVLTLLLLLASPLSGQSMDTVKVGYDSIVSLSRDSIGPTVHDTTYLVTKDTILRLCCRDSLVPKPAPPGPTLPAGVTLVATHTCSQLYEDGFTNRNGSARIVSDAGGTVCQAFYPAGYEGGRGPVLVGHPSKGTTVFVSFRLYIDPHWQGHGSGVNKVLHFWIGNPGVSPGNRLYLSAQGSGTGLLQAQVRLQGVAEDPVSRNLYSRLFIPRGQWVRWEVLTTANTNGLANGTVQWWIDGVQAGHVTNIRFTAGSPVFHHVDWNPTWGGMGGTLVQSQVMRIDDFAIAVR